MTPEITKLRELWEKRQESVDDWKEYTFRLSLAFPSILGQLEAAEKLVEAVREMGMKDLEESGGAMDDMRYGGNRMNEAWRNQRDAILKSFEEEMV